METLYSVILLIMLAIVVPVLVLAKKRAKDKSRLEEPLLKELEQGKAAAEAEAYTTARQLSLTKKDLKASEAALREEHANAIAAVEAEAYTTARQLSLTKKEMKASEMAKEEQAAALAAAEAALAEAKSIAEQAAQRAVEANMKLEETKSNAEEEKAEAWRTARALSLTKKQIRAAEQKQLQLTKQVEQSALAEKQARHEAELARAHVGRAAARVAAFAVPMAISAGGGNPNKTIRLHSVSTRPLPQQAQGA